MNTTWLVLAIILGIIAIVFFVMAAKKKNDEQPQRPREDPLKFSDGSADFGPDILGPGAIVGYGGIDYVCRGAVTMRQGAYTWHEYLLEGGRGGEYLSVDYDEGQLNLGWWVSRPDLDVQRAQEVTVEGVRYRKVESGVGQFYSEGTTGLPESGRFEYWDMAETGGNGLLGFETFGEDGSSEVSLGWKVLPGELTVYPAPKN